MVVEVEMAALSTPQYLAWTVSSRVRKARRSVLGRWESRLRSNPLFTLCVVSATVFAVFVDDVRLAACPKSADGALRVLFLISFGVFVLDMTLSLIFEAGYWRSIIFVLDLLATASMTLHPFFSGAGGDTEGLVLGRIARLFRTIRIMRAARFALVSTDIAMQSAEKKRLGAQQQLAGDAAGLDEEPRRESFFGIQRFQFGPDADRKPSLGQAATTPGMPPRTRRSQSKALLQAKEKASFLQAVARTGGLADVNSRRSTIGVLLMQNTTEKIVLIVLLLALGLQLLSVTVADRTVQNGLDLLDTVFPNFSASGCFGDDQAVASSAVCVESPCCADWEALVELYIGDVHFQGMHVHLKRLRVGGVTFLDESLSSLRDIELVEYDVNDSHVTIDASQFVANIALWSIGQTLLILLILLVFPYLFGHDVFTLVVTPLELIFDRLQSIAENPFSPMGQLVARKKRNRALEIDLIGESLHRLTKLLQVGLGQAGTDIIAKNLKSGNFSVLQAGNRLSAVFGFCNIRDFTDCCEVLQEECVVFVNAIAAVVGELVADSQGDVNKNLGEAFLMVWKTAGRDPAETAKASVSLTEAAQSALKACVRIARRVARSSKIQAYAKRKEIVERLGEGFSISTGFGLHVGWAIEGAVGSEQKIDATYLSPTVNMAARLESGAKQYGVPILMSHNFYQLLAEHTKMRCRFVDVVAVKGSEEPMTILSYEMSPDGMAITEEADEYFRAYVNGDWGEAKDALSQFMANHPNDGPAVALWEFLEQHDFVAPHDWSGFRKLRNK